MTGAIANQVFDLLVQLAGASERYREMFVQAQLDDCREFRFMGALGMGGKFWAGEAGLVPWHVSYYSEDRTPERNEIVRLCNERLRLLQDQPAR